jgi:hypothetical protein
MFAYSYAGHGGAADGVLPRSLGQGQPVVS